jgi:hypothetical protein
MATTTPQDEKAAQIASPHDAHHRDLESSTSLDKDEAIHLVGEHAREIDPVVEARVLRKIDLFLIPAMIVGMYSFFYSLIYNTASSYIRRKTLHALAKLCNYSCMKAYRHFIAFLNPYIFRCMRKQAVS